MHLWASRKSCGVPISKKHEKDYLMSNKDKNNQKNQSNKSNNKNDSKSKRPKYEDDRTPLVKKIDTACRFLAAFIAVLSMISLHIIAHDGGYDYKTPAGIMGYTVTNLETDQMEPSIPQKSAVFLNTKAEYQAGDIIFYTLQEDRCAGIIEEIDQSKDEVTICGENESKAVTVSSEAVVGKIIGHTHALYSFIGWYLSSVGVAVSVIICFVLIAIPDLLMFRKRKAAAQAKREAYEKKQERMLKVKQGKEAAQVVDPKTEVKQRRQEKIDKDRVIIDAEMKKIQEQMEQEEKELNLGGKK